MLKKVAFFILFALFSIQSIIAAVPTVPGRPPLCISLGAACGSALMLRELGLRTVAYPFDWMISPTDGLYKCLTEDFGHFFCDLKLRPDKTGVIDYYGFHFTHDLPTQKSNMNAFMNTDFVGADILANEWQKAVPQVQEKYNRRINRFREDCLGKEKVFFFRTEFVNKEDAILIRDTLQQLYPKMDFTLVVMTRDNTFKQDWKLPRIKNFFISGNTVIEWKKNLSLIDPVFKRYSL